MDIQPRGSFGKSTVVAFTDHEWTPANYQAPFMGLSAAGQHISGSFLVDGHRTVPIRHIENELAVRYVYFADGDIGSADLRMTKPPRAYRGFTELAERDGRWGWWEPGRADGFAYATGSGEAFWRESGTVEVTAKAVGCAHQFAVPDAHEPLAYQVRYFVVGGQDGEPVTGLIAHEQVYMRPGSGWYNSEYMQHLEQIWIAFFTQFADGSTVHGQILIGREGFCMAAIQESTGWRLATPRVVCDQLELDKDGFLENGGFELGDGSRWLFKPNDGGGGRLLLGEASPTWREGVVTRLGDTRPVVFSHTWAEVFPERVADVGVPQ